MTAPKTPELASVAPVASLAPATNPISRALDLAWNVLAVAVTAWLDHVESKPLPVAVR